MGVVSYAVHTHTHTLTRVCEPRWHPHTDDDDVDDCDGLTLPATPEAAQADGSALLPICQATGLCCHRRTGTDVCKHSTPTQ